MNLPRDAVNNQSLVLNHPISVCQTSFRLIAIAKYRRFGCHRLGESYADSVLEIAPLLDSSTRFDFLALAGRFSVKCKLPNRRRVSSSSECPDRTVASEVPLSA